MDTAVRCVLPLAQRLPHELLSEIFLEVSTIWWHSKKLQPPLLLGHICSIWRHVAHGTPKLWTTFSLRIRKTVEGGKVDHASFAKDWLARAHPYPLRVSLRVDAETLRRIMCAILPSAHRLQILGLDLPLTHYHPLVDFPAMFMPLLECVKLSVDLSDYSEDADLWVGRTTAFTAAPRLTSVTLSLSGLFGSTIHLPWWQFTTLDISGTDSDECLADICLNAFIQCTNLVDCTLNMDVCVWEFWEDVQHIPFAVLPYLKKLDVTFSGEGKISPFFQPLILPALKDLTVTVYSECAWNHAIFMEFTLRSSLDLERLHIWGCNIYANQLLEFLPHMRSLVKLEIMVSECLTDQLFEALCYRGMGNQNLVPKLKTLLLSDIQVYVDDNRIASMIESRWWTDDAPRMVSRLERVAVHVQERDIDAKVRERLDHCRLEGLDFRIAEGWLNYFGDGA